MFDFKEELKKFEPIVEIEQIDSELDLKSIEDIKDILKEINLTKQTKKQKA